MSYQYLIDSTRPDPQRHYCERCDSCHESIDCPSPATQTAASLPAPAAGQGVGTRHHFLCLFFSPAGRLAKVHQSDCMFAPGALVSFGRRWPA